MKKKMVKVKQLKDIANILRRDVAIATTKAGSGHPTTCFSCAEIMSVLFFYEMNSNDEFILSKGHAAPILYSALYRSKNLDHHPNSLRKIKSPLEGHPIPSEHLPFVKVATGSLGQGLSVGVGMALASKMQKKRSNVYVLIGDSESAEGSIYEALEIGSHYDLDNLIAIFDINKLGQTGETMLGYDSKSYEKRLKSFGWETKTINGHDINDLKNAFNSARKSKKPTAIIAKTIKGKGVSFLENKNGWHGKALSDEQLYSALNEIPNPEMPKISFKKFHGENKKRNSKKLKSTKYKIGEKISTREAYGNALANLAKADPNVISVDAEVSNSTKSEKVKDVRKNQFIESYIAEQNMAGMSLGLSKKGYNVFASSFAAFLTRAHDQIRMAAISKPEGLTFCGSHSGVSIGKDGASQMGLGDIAMFRNFPNSYVFYPSDAISAEKLVELAYKAQGLKYIRTTRPETPVLYKSNEKFPLGDFKILKKSKKDKAVLVGSGITLHECLKAHKILKEKGKDVAVIDLYCIKPFNFKKFINFVKNHGNRVIVSEDHYPEGGMGEMLSNGLINSKIKVNHLSVKQIPHSGKKEELLEKYKIDSKNIIKTFEN